MFDKDIVSQEYINFDVIAEEKKNDYLRANPFPNIILDKFFNDNFLSQVFKDFPDLSSIHLIVPSAQPKNNCGNLG